MKNLKVMWKKYSFTIFLAFLLLGLIDLRFALLAAFCMIGPIIVSIYKGRYWCGNICPRGNFYDNIIMKFSGKRRTPKVFRNRYFRLLVIIVMLSVFTNGIVKNSGNLYDMGMVFYRLIVMTTIVGLVLAFVFNERTWCNFCPMGSMASIVSHFRNKGNKNNLLNIDNSCVSCKICEKKCSMGIVPYDYKGDVLTHKDCIQCGKCVIACPKDSIIYNRHIY